MTTNTNTIDTNNTNNSSNEEVQRHWFWRDIDGECECVNYMVTYENFVSMKKQGWVPYNSWYE